MKKIFFAIIASAALLTSCEKEGFEKDFTTEVSTEEAQLRLANAGFEMTETAPLTLEDDYDFYTSGVVEYKKDGILLAKVDYGNGDKDEIATITKDGEGQEMGLKKDDGKSKFKKVIKEAIVKTDDCDYIVSGIIKYYEKGEWTATVDFGDGTCDDLAMKYTPEGEEIEFIISEWY